MKHAWMQKHMFAALLVFGGCSIGPQVETRHIFVHNGKPCTIMENKTVKVGTIDGEKADISKQDIGGWKAMPDDHFNAMKSLIERLQKENAELKRK